MCPISLRCSIAVSDKACVFHRGNVKDKAISGPLTLKSTVVESGRKTLEGIKVVLFNACPFKVKRTISINRKVNIQ